LHRKPATLQIAPASFRMPDRLGMNEHAGAVLRGEDVMDESLQLFAARIVHLMGRDLMALATSHTVARRPFRRTRCKPLRHLRATLVPTCLVGRSRQAQSIAHGMTNDQCRCPLSQTNAVSPTADLVPSKPAPASVSARAPHRFPAPVVSGRDGRAFRERSDRRATPRPAR